MFLSEIYENIMMALQALYANKLRALLTTLGIVIGVGATIAMVTLTEGMNKNFLSQVETLGLNFFQLRQYGGGFQLGNQERKARPRITIEDGEAIRELAPTVGKVVPTLYSFNTQVSYEDETFRANICGTVPDYPEVEGYYVERGRFLTADDVERRRLVCVLGANAVEELFPHQDPIGERITFSGVKFTVVGYLQEKGQMFGYDPDNYVNIPVSTFAKYYGQYRSVNMSLEPIKHELMDQAMEEVRMVMRQRHKLRFGEPDDFYLNKNDQIMESFERATGGAFLVVILVTALSLLVGSIGIMNIMLVSVTERTREIGIRKAIGARRLDIMLQFLVEAVVLSLVGGLIGIILGLGTGLVLSQYLSFVAATVPLWVIILGVSVAAGVGILSGLYPAFRASRLDPIDALSYE